MKSNHWYEEKPLGKYRYVVTCPVNFHVPEIDRDYNISKPDGQREMLVIIRDKILTILPGYAFDGATGGPDLEILMAEFLLHDFLCQIEGHPLWPLTRFKSDRIFFREAKRKSLAAACAYYGVIRICGGLHKVMTLPHLPQGLTVKPL